MNKLTIALLFFLQVTCLESFGQVPGITYQAVILSPEGKGLPGVNHTNIPLATQEICLRFSFLNQDGEKEYEEIIQTKTDPYGMVNVIIGKGEQVGGWVSSFDKITWSMAAKFLEVSLDKSGSCSDFTAISKQEFTAVPFALFSVNSGATDSEVSQGKSAYQVWIDLGNVGSEQDFIKSLKGPAGPQGPAGATGATGPAGNTGATGPAGTSGSNGLSAYQVWLQLGNTGTEANFIASLKGPTGAAGPQGPAGTTGATGPAGTSGAAGPAGTSGSNGLSAYQVWLQLGNTGTEANFIASLKGPTGAAGPQGPAGAAGADGAAASAATFVDLSTDQTVGGTKTFTNPIAGSITGNAATVTTLSNSAVLGQTLTGFSSGAGTVSATDNILEAIQKVDGNINAAISSVSTGKQNTLTNSADLAAALSDETGSGLAVFATSPTLTTPTIGVATATSVNKVAITAPTNGSTLTIADGKTLTASNSLTLTGTDASTLNIGTGGTLGTNAYTSTVFAPIASPNLTGTPLAPTPTAGDNTTKVATTEFVTNAVTTATSGAFVDLTTDQTVTGTKTFSNQITVNGITVGKGGGSINNNTAFGISSLGLNTTGTVNSAVGFESLKSNESGEANTAFGSYALRENQNGARNTAVGSSALQLTEAYDNTAIGALSAVGNTTGNNNVAIGSKSLQSNTAGSDNTSVGFESLLLNQTNGNTATGYQSMRQNIGGSGNAAFGSTSLYSNTSGTFNVAAGAQALGGNSTGNVNVALGAGALDRNIDGGYNTVLGGFAGRYISDGSSGELDGASDGASSTTKLDNSILIGAWTKPNANNETNQIVIGYNAVGNGSNTIQLGNNSITNLKTNGTITAGVVTYPKTDGTANQVLSTDGSGTLGWTTPTTNLTGPVTSIGNATAIANGTITNDMLANPAVANLSNTNTGDQTATTVVNVAAGTISAINVQAALNELDTEKATIDSPTFTTSLQVDGAASNVQSKVYGASETSLDFALSNLISTNASAGAFTLSNMKDGGTYTLAVTGGGTSQTATFTHVGLTFHVLRNVATTTGKTALYTFIVMGTDVYFSMVSVE